MPAHQCQYQQTNTADVMTGPKTTRGKHAVFGTENVRVSGLSARCLIPYHCTSHLSRKQSYYTGDTAQMSEADEAIIYH